MPTSHTVPVGATSDSGTTRGSVHHPRPDPETWSTGSKGGVVDPGLGVDPTLPYTGVNSEVNYYPHPCGYRCVHFQ